MIQALSRTEQGRHEVSALGTTGGDHTHFECTSLSRQPLAGDLKLAQVISRQLLRDAVGRGVRLKQHIPSRDVIAVPIALQKVSQSANGGRRHEAKLQLSLLGDFRALDKRKGAAPQLQNAEPDGTAT